MASLEDRLKSLRTKMVTNLTTRGVTADETMTLNVLSDKILSCTPIPTNILLETDKTELNTSTDPTATLTATVTDVNGSPVEGVSVEFFANNTSLSSSITSLGSGITNNVGKTTINYKPTTGNNKTIYVLYDTNKSNELTINVFKPLVADIYISTTGSDSNTGTTQDTAVATLAKAYNLVSDGGTIGIIGGDYTFNPTSRITQAKSFNIIGDENTDVIINAPSTNYPLISLDAYTTKISNITITNGNYGQGVFPAFGDTGKVYYKNCKFDSCSVYGISNFGSAVYVDSCIFKNCDKGVFASSNSAYVSNSYFENNKVGIYVNANLQVLNCIFNSNTTYAIQKISGTTELHCNTYKTTADKLYQCVEGSCPYSFV